MFTRGTPDQPPVAATNKKGPPFFSKQHVGGRILGTLLLEHITNSQSIFQNPKNPWLAPRAADPSEKIGPTNTQKHDFCGCLILSVHVDPFFAFWRPGTSYKRDPWCDNSTVYELVVTLKKSHRDNLYDWSAPVALPII